MSDGQSNQAGGLNISADPSELAPNEVRRLDNARLSTFGASVKRFGSRYLHASAIGGGTAVKGVFDWIKDDGTTQLLAVAGGKLHTAAYGVPTTWGQVTSPTLSSATYISFAAFRGSSSQVVYLADGGNLLKWDGTTLSRSTFTQNVSVVWVYNQRLYGVAGNDAILLASGLNNGDDLGDASLNGVQAPVRTFGESSLVGGVALGGVNLLFHRGGISKWVGVTQDDIAISAGTLGISPDVGTILPRSIVATETECYFLSDRGFYAVNYAGVRRISTNLDPDILSLITTTTNLCVAHHKFYREIVWYLPDVGFYAFNYQLQAWSGPWNGGYISPITHSCCAGINASSQPIVLVGTSTGFVKQMDYPQTFLDNVASAGTGGTTFTMVTQFRREYFGDPSTTKALRFFYLLAQLNGANMASLSWQTALQSGSFTIPAAGVSIWDDPRTVWNAFIWDGGGSSEYRVQAAGQGNFVDVTFTDSSNAQPLVSAIRSEAFDYGEAHGYA